MLIPLKVDVAMSRRPWVNYALMAAIIAVSLIGFADEKFFFDLAGIALRLKGTPLDGLDPDQIDEDTLALLEEHVSVELSTAKYPLPVLALTSSFLHADWLHLLGNMLFLWVFGNAVNYKLGHAIFPLAYLLAAVAGGMAHYLLAGGPVVGASTPINGVMATFLVFFPTNNVRILVGWRVFLWRVHDVSSIWIILLWVVWDLVSLWIAADSGVALWGHIGGFAAGFAFAMILAATGAIKPTPDEQTLIQVFGGS